MIRPALLLLALLGSSSPLLTGCADSCEDLQEICRLCRDPGQQGACEEAVDSEDQDFCARNLDSYEDICE